MQRVLNLLIYLHLINKYCYGRSNGVRATACMSMAPEHDNFTSQLSIAPVQVVPHVISISRGQQMKITIRSVAADYTFKGIFIEARAESSSGEILGSFSSPTDNSLKTMVCGGLNSAIVHANPSLKSNLLLVWKAPTDFRGFIGFRATIVEKYDVFWTDIESARILTRVDFGSKKTDVRMKNKIFVFFLLTLCVQSSLQSINGAPPSTCSDLTPRHGPFQPQNGNAPIEINVQVGVLARSSIPVTIRSKNDNFLFRGFVIQARTQTGEIIGTFEANENINLIECDSRVGAGATQTTNNQKLEIQLLWHAPDVTENLIFNFIVTVVESFDRFWIRQQSGLNVIIPNLGNTTTTPELPGNPPTITSQTTPVNDEILGIFRGCDETKTCLGIPENCYQGTSCEAFMAIIHNEATDMFTFELLSTDNQNYISGGISLTPLMGATSVVECVQTSPGEINAFTSWTVGRGSSQRAQVNQSIINMTESRFINGKIYCKVDRLPVSAVNSAGLIFDLRDTAYYLLIASGTLFNENTILLHDTNRAATTSPVFLTRSQTPPNDEILGIFRGCEATKTCLGIPENCYQGTSCDAFMAIIHNEETDMFTFEMLSTVNQNYMSAGISLTPLMGDTSVVECVQTSPGEINAFTSWTVGRGSSQRAQVNQSIIEMTESRFIDGKIYCKVDRVPVSEVNSAGDIFDLRNTAYYLLIASGTLFNENTILRHDTNRAATTSPVYLTRIAAPPAPPEDEIRSIFRGCRETKTCFGIPNDCFQTDDCEAFIAVIYNEESELFTFELLSKNNQNYIAGGVSLTPSMGGTSVVECVRTAQGSITAHASWTIGSSTTQRDLVDQTIINMTDYSFINGRIYCKVDRVAVSRVNDFGTIFDLTTTKFHLLLASGTLLDQNNIGYHDTNYGGSSYAVLLTEPSDVGGAVPTSTSPLLLIHGSFMVVAWIGLTSIGIVMARYFKSSWQNKKACGKDIWFASHIICMFMTFVLTLVGFIVIFVDVGGWRTSVHSVLGCVVFALSIIQPFGAIFRPDPKANARPIFNWMHKAFGNITHLLAIITIFYAVALPRASLPQYTMFVLAAFVTFYLLMHIIFNSINICGEMKKQKRLGVSTSKDAPYKLLQKTLLGFFVIIIFAFVIGLLLIFNLDFTD